MRVPIKAAVVAEDDAPPPYTAYDANPEGSPEYAPPEPTSLRGGYTRQFPEQQSEDSSHSTTADYFQRRQFQRELANLSLEILQHTIHFDYAFTPTRLPFPHPSDVFLSRDVTGQDWASFVNHLFPIGEEHHGKKSKADSDETTWHPGYLDSPQRREKVRAVVENWNIQFFAPRHIRVIAHFESSLDTRLPLPYALEQSPHQVSESRSFSPYQDAVNRDPPALGLAFPSASLAYPSQAGSFKLTSPRKLRHCGSQSSISSSSSSSSESSVDSIVSKDLDHASVPEIRALLTAFLADPHKKNHLRKSVNELRRQLRTQHLPFSSLDPYNSKASKEEKKNFKEQRKALKKEIKAIIKEAKNERSTEKKFRRAARKIRRDARKQEQREMKQTRRGEKHAHRHESHFNRDFEQPQSDPRLSADPGIEHQHRTRPFTDLQTSAQGIPSVPQARETTSGPSVRIASVATAASDRVQAVRTRSNEVIEAARHRSDAARESARQRANATRETASYASHRASNTAASAASRASDAAVSATRGFTNQFTRRKFDIEDRARKAVAQCRAE